MACSERQHVLRDSLSQCLVSVNTTAALTGLTGSIHFSETAASQIEVDGTLKNKQHKHRHNQSCQG